MNWIDSTKMSASTSAPTSNANNNAETAAVLYQYASDMNLISPDAECIAVNAYFHFLGIKYTVDTTKNHMVSPTGKWPMLRHGQNIVASFDNIVHYLRKQNYDLDKNLSQLQRAETQAFSLLIQEKLEPAVLYHWWVEENYSAHTRGVFFRQTPWLIKLFAAPMMRRKNASKLAKLGINDTMQSHKRAKECLEALKALLGDKKYFYSNDRPSTLDALAYGYLSCMYYPTLTNNSLKELVYEYSTLCAFCDNITSTFFEDYKPTITLPRFSTYKARKQEYAQKKTESKEVQEFNRRSRWFVGAALASVSLYLLVLYGPALLATRIVFVNNRGGGYENDEEDYYEEDEYYDEEGDDEDYYDDEE